MIFKIVYKVYASDGSWNKFNTYADSFEQATTLINMILANEHYELCELNPIES